MRLLVFNCHEAWVHQLQALNCEVDILVGGGEGGGKKGGGKGRGG